MRPEGDKSSLDYIEVTTAVERRMRNIFVASMCLSVLVLFVFAFLAGRLGRLPRVIRVSFPPILLWSFTVTGYAFYSLWRLTDERGRLLQSSAVTEPTTGVKSLSYISRVLQKEYERMIQTGQPTGVLYVDLENLDVVNQTFGHAVGDVVLKGVAGTIENGVPEEAVVGRVAGDEFVVVLPATKLEKAKSVAAAIEKSIRHYKLELGKKGCVDFLNCRIGIIACPKDGGFADEIIRIAQQAAVRRRSETASTEAIRSKLRRGN